MTSLILGLVVLLMIFLRRPKDHGAPHKPYFRDMNHMLQKHGEAQPTLMIDLDRVDKNLEQALREISPLSPRLVVKSLPSIPLLQYIQKKGQVNKFMVFHRPFLERVFKSFPSGDFLMGKPLPIKALKVFYKGLTPEELERAQREIQWLVDTPQRVRQYLDFAMSSELKLRLNFEIDIGLRRGGFSTRDLLAEALLLVRSHKAYLEFSGFMGYDAHVPKMPKPFKMSEVSRKSQKQYHEMIRWGKEIAPELFANHLTFNGAGSSTFSLHDVHSPVNDISIGSALLKPTDFDLKSLNGYLPAVFIASPVLKSLTGPGVPFIQNVSKLWDLWNPNRQKAYFIYGGFWKAHPCSPEGMLYNPIFGRSSNQECLNGSKATELAVDDYAFMRPTQSESVVLEFGKIMVVRGKDNLGTWDVLSQA